MCLSYLNENTLMFAHYSFFEFTLLACGFLMTPWISSFFIFVFSFLLKKIYYKHNQSIDDEIIFSCWGGTFKGNLLYSMLTLFMIIITQMAFFHHEPRLMFFSFATLLFIFIFCWNSLTRIEITKKGLAIYKSNLGTDTEIYRFNNSEIKSIHRQLTVGHLFSGGLNSWLIIKLYHGEEILFPPPNDEDLELFFGFLENKKIETKI